LVASQRATEEGKLVSRGITKGFATQPPSDVAFWPIVLQKSKVAAHQIFRENTKQKTIGDSRILNRVGEVAGGFDARGCVPYVVTRKPRL
jgi:hypothetical protein